jgi:hypothetical protein
MNEMNEYEWMKWMNMNEWNEWIWSVCSYIKNNYFKYMQTIKI